MKLEKNKDEYPMPAFSMICSVFYEVPGVMSAMLQIKLSELRALREKSKATGKPQYYAFDAKKDRILIYPAPAGDGADMHVAYLPPMMGA